MSAPHIGINIVYLKSDEFVVYTEWKVFYCCSRIPGKVYYKAYAFSQRTPDELNWSFLEDLLRQTPGATLEEEAEPKTYYPNSFVVLLKSAIKNKINGNLFLQMIK